MWKTIKDFKDYEVNTSGEVRSKDRYIPNRNGLVKGKVLKQRVNKHGYLEVYFTINSKQHTRTPHRLVAKAFIYNPHNYKQVNHINGIKTDNRVENLQWVNNSMNQLHAYKLGLQPSRKGESNSRAKLSYDDVTIIKTKYNSGMTISEISEEMNIIIYRIRQIIYGRTWKSHNMKISKRDDRFKKTT